MTTKLRIKSGTLCGRLCEMICFRLQRNHSSIVSYHNHIMESRSILHDINYLQLNKYFIDASALGLSFCRSGFSAIFDISYAWVHISSIFITMLFACITSIIFNCGMYMYLVWDRLECVLKKPVSHHFIYMT